MGRKKLKAFTIMEAIVVMVITGLLVSLGGIILMSFSQYLTSTNQAYRQTYEWKLFDTLLFKDWDAAAQIEFHGNELKCVKAGGTVVYVFEEKQIVRKHPLETKVFDLTITDIRAYQQENMIKWEGTLVLENEQTLTIYRVKQKTPAELVNELL